MKLVPVKARSQQRAYDGLDDHEIHELPVKKLLERQSPQRTRRLVIKPKRVEGNRKLRDIECDPVGDHPQRVHEQKAVEGEQIDDRADQRDKNVEDEQVRKRSAQGPPRCEDAPV